MTQHSDLIQTLTEITLPQPDNFLKIVETLQRIGIPDYKSKELTQHCYILYKREKYYIVHYKQLLLLDGINVTIDEDDINLKNSIVCLLSEWNLCQPHKSFFERNIPKSKMKVLSHKDRNKWTLISKYKIGDV